MALVRVALLLRCAQPIRRYIDTHVERAKWGDL
jgi:hypothetical protein